jgi:hypothetical protein
MYRDHFTPGFASMTQLNEQLRIENSNVGQPDALLSCFNLLPSRYLLFAMDHNSSTVLFLVD